MTRYRVYMQNIASYYVEVEAEDSDMAIEVAEAEGLPDLMMLDHRYPETGGWSAMDDDYAVEEIS